MIPLAIATSITTCINAHILGSTHRNELQNQLKLIGININRNEASKVLKILTDNSYLQGLHATDIEIYKSKKEKNRIERRLEMDKRKTQKENNRIEKCSSRYTKLGITNPETINIIKGHKAFFYHYRDILPTNLTSKDIRGVGTNAIIIKRKKGFVDKFPFKGLGIADIKEEFDIHKRFLKILEKGKNIMITAEIKDNKLCFSYQKKIIDQREINDPLAEHFIETYFGDNIFSIKTPFISKHINIPQIQFIKEKGFEFLRIEEVEGNTVSTLYDIQNLYGSLLEDISLPEGIDLMTDYQFEEFLKKETGKTSEQLAQIQLEHINKNLLGEGYSETDSDNSGIPTLKLLFNETRSHYIEFTLALYYLNIYGLGHIDLHNENIMVDKDKNISLIDFGKKAQNSK